MRLTPLPLTISPGSLAEASGWTGWSRQQLPTAVGRAEAALGSLTLAGNFNEERNTAPIRYYLNFRSESTRYPFYRDTVFNSPELHADEIFKTLPLIKAFIYK